MAEYFSRHKVDGVILCPLDFGDEWKMLIAAGQIVPSDETLAGTWSWVQVKDHDTLYRTLLEGNRSAHCP